MGFADEAALYAVGYWMHENHPTRIHGLCLNDIQKKNAVRRMQCGLSRRIVFAWRCARLAWLHRLRTVRDGLPYAGHQCIVCAMQSRVGGCFIGARMRGSCMRPLRRECRCDGFVPCVSVLGRVGGVCAEDARGSQDVAMQAMRGFMRGRSHKGHSFPLEGLFRLR